LITILTSVPLRSARRAKNRHHRRVARQREATFVVMRVPERKLLTAMCHAERVVDVEESLLARLQCRAGLIKSELR
jgi:hypothetical protein